MLEIVAAMHRKIHERRKFGSRAILFLFGYLINKLLIIKFCKNMDYELSIYKWRFFCEC